MTGTALILFFIFVLLHIIVCVVLAVLIKADIMKISSQLFALEIFVPFWGFIMLLAAEYMSRRRKNGTKDSDVDDFTVDKDSYMAIQTAQQESADDIVPVEEALLVNDSKVKRELITDIIEVQSNEYLPILQKARVDEDVDVAHFASTAIMERRKAYQLNLTKQESLLSGSPDNTEYLDGAIDAIADYIESNLFEGIDISLKRQRYNELLLHRISLDSPTALHYNRLVRNAIELKNFIVAKKFLEKALLLWKDSEMLLLTKLELGRAMRDGEYVDETIAQMESSDAYFSKQAKQIMNFWKGS